MSPEPESIAQAHIYLPFLGLVQGKIHFIVQFRIRRAVIDGGWSSVVFHGQYGSD